jgi:hypothetical protein
MTSPAHVSRCLEGVFLVGYACCSVDRKELSRWVGQRKALMVLQGKVTVKHKKQTMSQKERQKVNKHEKQI